MMDMEPQALEVDSLVQKIAGLATADLPKGANAAGLTPREPGMPAEKHVKMAYVTFLAAVDDIHLKSVLELNRGLRNVGAIHPLVVVVPRNLPEADRLTLRNEGCIIHEMEVALRPPLNEDDGHIGVYGAVNSKLSICKEYERVVFLDARIKALRKENLDELFHLEEGYLYAWFEGFRRDKEWIRTPQYKIVYNGQEPQPQPDEMVAIAWARDDLVSVYFNAAVFVHEPGAMDFSKLLLDALSKLLLDALSKPFTGKSNKMFILDAEGAEVGGPISA